MARSIFLRGFDQDMAERVVDFMGKKGTKFVRPAVPTKFEQVDENGTKKINVTWVNQTSTVETSVRFIGERL